MADAKDILGLPKGPLSTSLEKKPNRAHKDSQRKPEGVSREVYALTGGLPLLMATLDVSHLKRRPPSDKEKDSFFTILTIQNRVAVLDVAEVSFPGAIFAAIQHYMVPVGAIRHFGGF